MSAERLNTGTARAELRLVSDAELLTHLVCCRDVSWQRTFCGLSGADSVNPAAEVLCTMCLDAMEAMSPGCVSAPVKLCPVDDRRCPDPHEIDLRTAAETGPATDRPN